MTTTSTAEDSKGDPPNNRYWRRSLSFRRKAPKDNTAHPDAAPFEPEYPTGSPLYGRKHYSLSSVSLNLLQNLKHKVTPTDNVTRNEATAAEDKPPYAKKHSRLFNKLSKRASVLETETVAPARTDDLRSFTESLPGRISFFFLKKHSTGNTEGERPIVPESLPITLDSVTKVPQGERSVASIAGPSSGLPMITISPASDQTSGSSSILSGPLTEEPEEEASVPTSADSPSGLRTAVPDQPRRSSSLIRKLSFNSVSNGSTSGEPPNSDSTGIASTQSKNYFWKDNIADAREAIALKEEEMMSIERETRRKAENLRRTNSTQG